MQAGGRRQGSGVRVQGKLCRELCRELCRCECTTDARRLIVEPKWRRYRQDYRIDRIFELSIWVLRLLGRSVSLCLCMNRWNHEWTRIDTNLRWWGLGQMDYAVKNRLTMKYMKLHEKGPSQGHVDSGSLIQVRSALSLRISRGSVSRSGRILVALESTS